ncbi:unnamed protein product [Vicia faba]|uniref:Replication protein A 70 kDa DNA-binding subunit B/D first OB fold domain-containing protein n=1 Tax=Vicia faba TaxID=3906 RepID=A0AAV1BA85_VICFA|nr:unnamed protein product [Vicia faba]
MARPFEMISDINDRKELWKIVIKMHHKWMVTTASEEYFEMVVFDKHGHDIHVVVPTVFKQTFDSILSVNVTCTMSTFQIQPNDLMFKHTNHKFLLKFTGGTTVGDIGKHKIYDKISSLTPFADLISGKWQRNVLCDGIGVVDEVSYTQSHMGGKKPQVNLVLHDLGGNILNYTLWEAYVMEFLEYQQKQVDSTKPIVIILRYAKVKEQGKFPPAVTNTYNVTKLQINEDITDINEFIKRYTPNYKLLASEHGLCYTTCHQCPQVAKGKRPSFFYRVGHQSEAEIWRYKIFIEVVHEGNTAKFVLWDREAAELLDTSAAQMQATMIHVRITDPLEFPLSLDSMLGKKFAFKVKWDPRWKSSSIVLFIKDNHLIAMLEGPIAINQEGEITSPHVPDPANPKSNVKRMSPDGSIDSFVNLIAEGDLSSTKVKKVTKQGKKTAV